MSHLKLVVNNDFFFFESIEKEKEKFNKYLKLVQTKPDDDTPNSEETINTPIRKKAV